MNADPKLFVDIHIIQTVPPANLNRDDAGSPKQAMYGGDLRARVSSQAWKRAARLSLQDLGYSAAQLGVRTDMVPNMLKTGLVERGWDSDQAERVAIAARRAWGIKAGKADRNSPVDAELKTSYLLFLGREQVDHMADLLGGLPEIPDNDKDLDKAMAGLDFSEVIGSGHPVDVALFGRMVADRASWNVDASTQVAHALSTHPIDVEFDYYTAVDDENTAEETGAGMIGTIEFNSATFYRYANVGFQQLLENLEGDVGATIAALKSFVRAFTFSMPSGHQNSFGNRTAPQLVTLVVRKSQPVNLVTAFERAVLNSTEGIAASSMRRLGAELAQVADRWGLSPIAVNSTYVGDSEVPGVGPSLPFDEALNGAAAAVATAITGT